MTPTRIFSERNAIILVIVMLIAGAGAYLYLENLANSRQSPTAKQSGSEPASISNNRVAEVWTCSMHPHIRMSQPGACPICSMPLVRIADPSAAGSAGLVADVAEGETNQTPPAMLELSEHAMAMASVETTRVERRQMSREIRMVGKVQYNEAGLANVTVRVEGYVERLFVDYTGVEVKRGDHLAEIYSPDLVIAQQEMLVALVSPRSSNLVASVTRKLLRWGLTQKQVDDLKQHRTIHERVTLFSPIEGTVIEKQIVEKAMVKPGDTLYRLANLESVWVYLDVYEYELPWIQNGQRVEIKAEAMPGHSVTGRVWFISPVLDEETRSVKVLVNIQNVGKKLKPGMYVTAMLRADLMSGGKPAPTGIEGQWTCPMHPLVLQPRAGQCPVCEMTLVQIPGAPVRSGADDQRRVLAVPVTAVLDSGVRKMVYVEKSKGRFAPVEIVTGPRTDDAYPVLSGLSEGDQVVTRGSFLLDSQLQIRGLPSLFYKAGQVGSAGHAHGAAMPPSADPAALPIPAANDAESHDHTQHKP